MEVDLCGVNKTRKAFKKRSQLLVIGSFIPPSVIFVALLFFGHVASSPSFGRTDQSVRQQYAANLEKDFFGGLSCERHYGLMRRHVGVED